MTDDPEIVAMGVLVEQLEPLSQSERARIVGWARERFVRGPSLDVFKQFEAISDAVALRARELALKPGELDRAVDALMGVPDVRKARP